MRWTEEITRFKAALPSVVEESGIDYLARDWSGDSYFLLSNENTPPIMVYDFPNPIMLKQKLTDFWNEEPEMQKIIPIIAVAAGKGRIKPATPTMDGEHIALEGDGGLLPEFIYNF